MFGPGLGCPGFQNDVSQFERRREFLLGSHAALQVQSHFHRARIGILKFFRVH
jgi:hypothetical protein